jgi:hypothetical protein
MDNSLATPNPSNQMMQMRANFAQKDGNNLEVNGISLGRISGLVGPELRMARVGSTTRTPIPNTMTFRSLTLLK